MLKPRVPGRPDLGIVYGDAQYLRFQIVELASRHPPGT
jgi:hypothetical protein